MRRFVRLGLSLNLKIFHLSLSTVQPLPLVSSLVPAGFPSPADDYAENRLDLNTHLISNPAATFIAKVSGYSMEEAGIVDGDLLIVDRSEEVKHHDIAVCVVNGEFTVKRLMLKNGKITLKPESRSFQPTEISEEHQFMVWGKVMYVIHQP